MTPRLGSRHNGWWSAVMALLCLAAPLAAAEPTIEIRGVTWGFDGTAMRDRFVPLTLIVDNAGREPFDGRLFLSRTDFAGRRIGGYQVEAIYLAPATQRKVQFYPLALSDMDEWKLSWEGGEAKLPKPRFGGAARILLAEDGEIYDRGGAVKRFPERYFPPFATATDALGEVVLDHAPDWEPPQRQAFLDWLKQGGTVHVLQSPGGTVPRFSGDLTVLNEPSDEFRIGTGVVRRHAINRSGLTRDYVRRQLDAPPRPLDETPEDIERANEGFQVYSYPLEQWRMTSGTFNQLKQMVSVEHNWAVIHLLSLSYVAVLFPGCFLIGREFRNVPATFGAMIGATLLFGGAFYLVGNRGYGESTNVHAVALAEHVDGDRFDTMVWSNVFVIAGGDYIFSHQGQERLYSDATESEVVGGETTSGSTGQFHVDVPPYSTRIMAHKALVRIPGAAAPKHDSDSAGGGVTVFTLPVGFPSETWQTLVIIDREVFTYTRSDDQLRPVGDSERVRDFLQIKDADFVANTGMWQEEPTIDKRLTQLVRPLILYSLRLTTDDELKSFYVPPGRAKVFVYAPLAEPFQVLSNAPSTEGENGKPELLPSQSGGVLYSFDVAI